VVETGGLLIFRPHPLILATGADLNQKVTLDLAEGACLQYEERWCAGRIAMGERWQFARFTNCLEISVADILAYRERWILEPANVPVTHPLICGRYVQFSSLYCFGLDLPIQTDIPESQLSWSLIKGNGRMRRWVS
jgi:urease accessory protein UreH